MITDCSKGCRCLCEYSNGILSWQFVMYTCMWCEKMKTEWLKLYLPNSWRKIKPTRCRLLYLLYFLDTQHVSGTNMSIFRSLRLCFEPPHWLYCSCIAVCWSLGAVRLGRYPGCWLKQTCASAGSPDTTLAEPHPNPNTHQSKNNTANVVFQQHSRKLPKMDILMPETCWVSKK